MDGQRGLTPRQMAAIGWAAAVAPAAGALPAAAARRAEAGGWLAPGIAAGLVTAAVWLTWRVTERGQKPLSCVWRHLFGQRGATALTIIYIMWAVGLMAVRLRLSAARLELTAQGQRGLWLCAAAGGLAALWLAWGKVDALGRAAQLFWVVLAAALAVVALQSAGQIRLEELWPVWVEDVPGIGLAGLEGAGTLGIGIYTLFLAGPVKREKSGWRADVAAGAVLVTAVLAAQWGVLGAALIRELDEPALVLAAATGVQNGLGRLEGLIAALWLLSDLAALALLLGAVKQLIRQSGSGKNENVRVALVFAASFLTAAVVFQEEETARAFQRTWEIWGGLFLGVVLPALVYFVWRSKEDRKGEHTSCG